MSDFREERRMRARRQRLAAVGAVLLVACGALWAITRRERCVLTNSAFIPPHTGYGSYEHCMTYGRYGGCLQSEHEEYTYEAPHRWELTWQRPCGMQHQETIEDRGAAWHPPPSERHVHFGLFACERPRPLADDE